MAVKSSSNNPFINKSQSILSNLFSFYNILYDETFSSLLPIGLGSNSFSFYFLLNSFGAQSITYYLHCLILNFISNLVEDESPG